MRFHYAALVIQAIAAHSIDRSLATHEKLMAKRALCSRDISCILNAEVMEGPFYVAEPLVRSDIVEDRPGAPLELTIQVLDVRTCEPAKDLWVDIWHADGQGVYSGWAKDENLVSLPSFPASEDWSADTEFLDNLKLTKRGIPIESSRWLRGVQRTDSEGQVQFSTIVPGWYAGRADHIHVRVHSSNATVQDGHLMGGTISHTGQLFFDDALIEELRSSETGVAPYNARSEIPRKNDDDRNYVNDRGSEQVVKMLKSASIAHGYEGSIIMGVDPTTIQPPEKMPGGGPPGGRPGHGPPGRGGHRGPWITLAVLLVIAGASYGGYRYYKQRQATGRIVLQ